MSVNKRTEEIKNFTKKYSEVLKALRMDVAHSEFEDRWFIFRYNPTFTPSYEFFIEFNNGEELVDCILSELSYEMRVEIDEEDVEAPECEKSDISDRIEQYHQRDSHEKITII